MTNPQFYPYSYHWPYGFPCVKTNRSLFPFRVRISWCFSPSQEPLLSSSLLCLPEFPVLLPPVFPETRLPEDKVCVHTTATSSIKLDTLVPFPAHLPCSVMTTAPFCVLPAWGKEAPCGQEEWIPHSLPSTVLSTKVSDWKGFQPRHEQTWLSKFSWAWRQGCHWWYSKESEKEESKVGGTKRPNA